MRQPDLISMTNQDCSLSETAWLYFHDQSMLFSKWDSVTLFPWPSVTAHNFQNSQDETPNTCESLCALRNISFDWSVPSSPMNAFSTITHVSHIISRAYASTAVGMGDARVALHSWQCHMWHLCIDAIVLISGQGYHKKEIFASLHSCAVLTANISQTTNLNP